ncbi:MAG: adenosylmethionine decarboxylase, partial [Pseudomonadota bacterium]|nr:adenosylmethionine decarboxylase [Pseudomonadota bacterium]
LTDQTAIELAMRDAAITADATILAAHLQKYSESGGISGVLGLAESHMSIHTWPERNFAAIDIFMCGVCNPYLAVPVLERAFQPQSMSVNVQRRGLVP